MVLRLNKREYELYKPTLPISYFGRRRSKKYARNVYSALNPDAEF